MTEVKEKDCVNEEAEPVHRETVENSDGNIAAAAEVAPRRPPEGGGKSEAAEGEKAADGEFDAQEEAGLKELQALEEIAERQARSRTVALQILGDIPDTDFKPPDNVLFICKLNPYTEEDDLETLFVRFGKILSCDIIRDWKTNDSLQYGFIEFEKKESAEAAYFKMQNVLVDDRRIHVGFCQSVGRQYRKFKKEGNTASPEDADAIGARENTSSRGGGRGGRGRFGNRGGSFRGRGGFQSRGSGGSRWDDRERSGNTGATKSADSLLGAFEAPQRGGDKKYDLIMPPIGRDEASSATAERPSKKTKR
eukprot:GHVU01110203.1.p1 GENE.GHVU01110203.1~~GHVU01110203.1.p1  ORF type:complete len:308 (+),score=47.64 GHVU01110203.1:119-1042(+)